MLGRSWVCLASQSNRVLHCRKAGAFLYSSHTPPSSRWDFLPEASPQLCRGMPGHGHPRHANHTLENKGLSVRAFNAKIKSLCCLKLGNLRVAAGLHSSWKCSSQCLVLGGGCTQVLPAHCASWKAEAEAMCGHALGEQWGDTGLGMSCRYVVFAWFSSLLQRWSALWAQLNICPLPVQLPWAGCSIQRGGGGWSSASGCGEQTALSLHAKQITREE